MNRLTIHIIVALLSVLYLVSASATTPADWLQVKGPAHCGNKGRFCGINGMVLLDRPGVREFLVVHDGKNTSDPRLGIVTFQDNDLKYRFVEWPGDKPPFDLEALSKVPGQTDQFLAVTSNGELVAFQLTKGDKVEVLTGFPLQLPKTLTKPALDIEGFNLQKLGNHLVMIWGHRGENKTLGYFYYQLLDLKYQPLTKAVGKEIKAPIPDDPNARHISDLKLDENGLVWTAAPIDPGPKERNGRIVDEGPFQSVVYILGILTVTKEPKVIFDKCENPEALWNTDRKIEAIELVPAPAGGVALGAEDEDFGGWFDFKKMTTTGIESKCTRKVQPLRPK